jgi:hypothetical protein
MKPIINFIFSIGYRCNSPDFLKIFKLRKMSGPFDYLFIDFESSLKLIKNNFDDFLSDIVLVNKNSKKIDIIYNRNTRNINKNFYELLDKDIGYMGQNFNINNLFFNQNYLHDNNNKLSNNLFFWDSICCFRHHNLLDNGIYNSIKNRCDRFNKVTNKYEKTTALFYITKIITCENLLDYTNKLIEVKKKYSIEFFLIIIINCDNVEDTHYYNEDNKCLFIIKKVENYENQHSKYKTDNNLNLDYEKEFNIISDHFNLNIIGKNDI